MELNRPRFSRNRKNWEARGNGKINEVLPELRERALRLVEEVEPQHTSRWAAICSVASKFGCKPEALRKWLISAGHGPYREKATIETERRRTQELERENRELRRTNEILRKASAFFRTGTARPPIEVMVDFIEDNRDKYGVEPICKVLPIAPSTYYAHRAPRRDPSLQADRVKRDEKLCDAIKIAWKESHDDAYGARKVWRDIKPNWPSLARFTVERLIRRLGLRGVTRGRAFKFTTIPDLKATLPQDLVQRNFQAARPNQLWVADLTYVTTWRGFVYVTFVVVVFSRAITKSCKSALGRRT